MKGHWFCSYCNDVKFLPHPAADSLNDVERCLDCKNNSLTWVPAVEIRRGKVSLEQAAEEFKKIKDSIVL